MPMIIAERPSTRLPVCRDRADGAYLRENKVRLGGYHGKIAGKEESVQRLPAEQLYQEEIDALIAAEQDPVPTGWRMSPRSVLTYITGGTVGGKEITPKYIGNRRLVEIAIATLVTDRALLLIGEPGTAKSWLSEHLTAAINGDSTKVIQGTAGTTEEHIRYSWNYAMLIAQGPSREAMIKALYTAPWRQAALPVLRRYPGAPVRYRTH